MNSSIHEFDQGGDTEIVLVTNQLQFLWEDDVLWMGIERDDKKQVKEPLAEEVPPESADEPPSPPESAQEISVNEVANEVLIREFGEFCDPPSKGDEVLMRMRVSSRHLILASSVFRNMLEGPFKEGIVNGLGHHQLRTSKWDTTAMTILLNIIHSRHREVPRSLSLETLAKFAIIVDYYQCHEAVEVFVGIWLEALKRGQKRIYGKESMLWLLVSWVFSQAETFEIMTRLALMYGENTIAATDLPIPGDILSKINEKREEALTAFFESLYDLYDTLCDEPICSFECSSMLLGALTKGLRQHGILSPRAAKPFAGHSMRTVKDMVNSFQTPIWSTRARSNSSSGGYHSCSIIAEMQSVLMEVERDISGLRLEDYGSETM